MSTDISRRTFLKGSLAVGGLTIAVSMGPLGTRLLNASQDPQALKVFNPSIWYKITPDNILTTVIGSSEMGQGAHSALSMILADELEVDWKQVRTQQGPAAKEFINPFFKLQITVGSSSVRAFYDTLRQAGAAGRSMLVQAAAARWKVPESECSAELGKVKHGKSGRSLTYGQICLDAAKLSVPKSAPLKKESEFRYIGKVLPRLDIPAKVSGKAVFGLDVDLPDLHYAVIARPPAYGAKPIYFDEKAAEKVKGVVKVASIPMGIAVCARTLQAAWQGRDALKVKWDQGTHPQMDNNFIEKTFMEDLDKPGSKAAGSGDAAKALAGASQKVKATYYVPFVAHATMEPMNCTAELHRSGHQGSM
jgi:isoquinoline 1-oxidoreductase beta subunit